MKRAILTVLAGATVVLAPVGIPPPQAHAGDDPCAAITDPAAYQDCISDYITRREQTQCDASSNHGQLGQLCG